MKPKNHTSIIDKFNTLAILQFLWPTIVHKYIEYEVQKPETFTEDDKKSLFQITISAFVFNIAILILAAVQTLDITLFVFRKINVLLSSLNLYI